jgi:hypothetical protein
LSSARKVDKGRLSVSVARTLASTFLF